MNRKLLALTVSVVIVASGLANGQGNNLEMNTDDVVVYYIPLNHETYVPVTRLTIERNAVCVLSIPSRSDEAAFLRGLVEDASQGVFDDRFVRVKATGLFENPLYFDKLGGLYLSDLDTRKITSDGREALSRFLNRIAVMQQCEIDEASD